VSLAPVLFVSHGAPTEAIELDGWTAALGKFGREHPRPRAIVAVSAHWVTQGGVLVTGAPSPKTLHDFSGFPEQLYRIRYPAPGDRFLAERIAELLAQAGNSASVDKVRGLDHGAWSPLVHGWPLAEVPVVQVSLPLASPQALLALGAALAPFRAEGVLLLASGGAVHNLGELELGRKEGPAVPWAAEFDGWLAPRVAARDLEALARWKELAPHAERAHPSTEHFDPLLVAMGAGMDGDTVEVIHEGIVYGSLGMRSFVLRQ
jgi:4,5-DOPA dioxygenase extradiol